MSTVRRNAIASLVGRVATALLWVVVTPYVLARLGVERFGIWALFFAFSGYLTTFDLGIGDTMRRFIAVERASGDRRAIAQTLGRGLRLALGLGLLWAVLVALLRSPIARAFHVPEAMTPEALQALLVFAIGALLLVPVQVLTGSLQGFERLDLSNLCMFIGVVAHVGALYAGLATGGGLTGVALAGVVGQAVTGLAAAIMVVKQMGKVQTGGSAPGASWRDLLHYGFALQLTNTLAIVQLQAGKVLLGLLGNLAMVAHYELAFRVASGVAGMPVLILGAVAPTVTRVWEKEGPAAVGHLYTSTLRWLYTYGVITLGLLWLTAPDLTRVWLGPEHDAVAPLIRLWAVAYGVNLAWSLGAAVARSIGKPWIEVSSLAASVLANVALGFWWVPRYGTAGAVVALASSYGAGFITFALLSRRSGIPYGPWIGRELLPRVVAASLAVAVCAILIGMAPLSGFMPPLGWVHGGITGALFLTIFALFFAPLGDTQRLSHTLWGMTAGVLARRRAEGSP